MIHRDLSSLSNPHQFVVTHLDWTVGVDFETRRLACEATYAFQVATAALPTTGREEGDKPSITLDLDTAHLLIESVVRGDNGEPLPYELHPAPSGDDKSHLGRKLSVDVSSLVLGVGNVRTDVPPVTIKYRTTEGCTAIQWLPPSQTSSKMYPYLFTQCQAIHARSIVPCQDLPVRHDTKYSFYVMLRSFTSLISHCLLRSCVFHSYRSKI